MTEYDISDFVCQRCGNCCRGEGFVKVTAADARNIAAFLQISTEEFYELYTIKMDAMFWLKDKPNKDCIFLEGSLCRVNSVKPQQCRDFPWKWRTIDIGSYCHGVREQEKKPV